MVGLCACSQRVSQTKPNLLMNVIETQRACWPFHTLDILSFELVVGHVSTVRTRLVTNEDESVAVVCCEGSLPVPVPRQRGVAHEDSPHYHQLRTAPLGLA